MHKALVATLATLVVALSVGTASAGSMKVKIGTEGAYPPFNYMDDKGHVVGFDIDIANALCDAAGYDCEFVLQDWDGMIPGLIAKKYDAIVASMSITEERKKKVDFTNKYYASPARFFAAKGSGIEISKQGLKGKIVGTQRGGVGENFLRDNFGDVVEIRVYATQDEANADLVAGRIDLGFTDAIAIAEGFLKTKEGAGFEQIGPEYSDRKWFGDGIGIAIRKGDSELVEGFNKAIAKIRANGTYAKINARYFDFDVYGAE